MALSGFAPSGYGSVTALDTGQTVVALPGGGGPTLVVTAINGVAAVALQTGSAPPSPVLTSNTGMIVKASDGPLVLTVGSNDHIVVAGCGFGNSQLNLVQGT